MRLRGEPITDRLVSIFDPDARPIRKGKLGKPNEFGYVTQICEVTENTKRGARGLILPAASQIGNPHEDTLLRDTVRELERLRLRPREVALDGGFKPGPTRDTLHNFEPERTFIAGSQQPGSRRRQRRLARYRTGTEGRVSHLKRGYGQRRSGLKDHHGQQTWTAGGSSPTTSPPSPSAPAETLAELASPPSTPIDRDGRATAQARPFHSPAFIRGK